MDISEIIKATILGFVEGLTEFIPISSTAHLLLSAKLIDFSAFQNGVFEVVIQLGAILAVIVFYRKKFLGILLGIFHQRSSQNFIFNIAIAFLPSAIFGLLFYKIIKLLFFNPTSIAIALIAGGIAILIVEKINIKPKYLEVDNLSISQSLKIGLFQVLSMLPGVSRSGATIIGGLLLGLNRKTATEFSFFLSVPTILSASLFDFYKNYDSFDNGQIILILIGFVASFLSSLIVIKWFINFVSNHNFVWFAYYRIILGFILLIILF